MADAPSSATSSQAVPTITEAICHRFQQTPDKPAFIFRAPNSDERDVLTYRDLYQLGGRWASLLHLRGIGRGQYVVNTLPNSPERAVVDSAILLSGAACVNAMCQLKDASDLKTILRQSAAVAVALDPDFMPDVYEALLQDVTEPMEDGSVSSESLPDLKFVLLVRRQENNPGDDFMSSLRLRGTGELFCEEGVMENDVCVVCTTSGSTGFPKLVVFSHSTLVAIAKLRNRPANSVIFHIGFMGWGSGYFGNTVLAGVTRVLCDVRAGLPQDLALFVFKSVKEERVTSGAVPIYVIPDLVKKVEALNSGHPIFGTLGLGVQPITKVIVKEASKVARVLIAAYAGTEMMLVSSVMPVDVNTFEDYFMGSIARGVEVKICDDQGQEVKASTRGEILAKSPYLFRDYLNDPKSTADAFTEDGYFRTGDVGWLDSEGHLYAEGRSKDAIMQGRQIVFPGNLESRILNCPAVRDVMVVGVPDVLVQNELCVCVVLQSEECGTDDVKQYVEKDIRPDYTDGQSMRPRYYMVFESFPLISTGKPHRAEVKRMAEQRLLEDHKSADSSKPSS